MLRTLAERIELTRDGEELAIALRDDRAATLTFACGKKSPAFLERSADRLRTGQ
jgi:hypothetical protein